MHQKLNILMHASSYWPIMMRKLSRLGCFKAPATHLRTILFTLFSTASSAWAANPTLVPIGGTISELRGVENMATTSNVYFVSGNTLWKSGGSAATTVQVQTFASTPKLHYVSTAGVFFSVGSDFRFSNGTANGSVSLGTYTFGISAFHLVSLPGGVELFHPDTNMDFVQTDGTMAGTKTIVGTAGAALNAGASEVSVLGSSAYFVDPFAQAIKRIQSGVIAETSTGVFANRAATCNGKIFFSGTALGNPGFFVMDALNGAPTRLAATTDLYTCANNILYITLGKALWATTGTPASTVLLANFVGSFGAYSQFLGPRTDRLYFVASSSTAGAEPWVSDGTPTGTAMYRDTAPGPTSPQPLVWFRIETTNKRHWFGIYELGGSSLRNLGSILASGGRYFQPLFPHKAASGTKFFVPVGTAPTNTVVNELAILDTSIPYDAEPDAGVSDAGGDVSDAGGDGAVKIDGGNDASTVDASGADASTTRPDGGSDSAPPDFTSSNDTSGCDCSLRQNNSSVPPIGALITLAISTVLLRKRKR